MKQSTSSSSNNPGDPPGPVNPGSPTPGGSPTPSGPDQPGAINHIIVFLQENRSLDSYFGLLSSYWANHGYPVQPFDGLPLSASNPGCDPSSPSPGPCLIDGGSPPVSVFHLQTMCVELTTPSWNEAHADFSVHDPANGPATLDGFVASAARLLRSGSGFHDVNGRRAMGYYNGSDLNYYYFMASNFATSDRWFSPVMAMTQPNRMYLYAATSHGHAFPLVRSSSGLLSDKTIFQLLQDNGISWKIYVHPLPDSRGSGCTAAACLMFQTYINMFTFQNDVLNKYPQNLVPISQYFTDLTSGTLPQVAFIEPASDESLDEHPSLTDPINIQLGAKYAASIINALMQSPAWVDSAFIFSFDEFGGMYDHVPPEPAVSPDGIKPSDLQPGDVCRDSGGANCDFTQTGYRVPLIVISPYAKKNYVSHTVADYTAILKFIETRFHLPSLTARDAAQMDMSEFFDMNNPPWMTPPNPPAQNTGGACYLDHLP